MKNIHKAVFKNQELKRVFYNFISLSGLKIFGMVLPIVVLPYVIRVLGFDKYGIIILATALISYFQSITDYSFHITATRDVALFKNSNKKLSLIFSRVIIVKTLFLFLSAIIIGIIVLVYPPFYEHRIIYFLTILTLIGSTLFPEWYFMGVEKMGYISGINIIIKILFTGGVFIFIKTPEDYWIYPLLQGGGLVLSGLIGLFIIIKKYKLRFYWIKFRRVRSTIKLNFPIFINQFVPNIYNSTSTLLLGMFASANLVGIYDAIKKIVDLLVALLGNLSRVFFPYINRNKDIFFRYRKVLVILGAFLALAILSLHELLFWYLNIKHESSFLILLILVGSIVGIILYDIYGVNYFIIKQKDKLVMKNTLYVSFIGFLTAFPLVFFFGILGAATNLFLSRLFMGLGLYFKYYQDKKLNIAI